MKPLLPEKYGTVVRVAPALAGFLIFTTALGAQPHPSEDVETSFALLRAFENVRLDLCRRIRDGVVTVEVVRNDFSSSFLTACRRCTDECHMVLWKKGELTEEEQRQWQVWGDLFLDLTRKSLALLKQNRANERDTQWEAFFEQVHRDLRKAVRIEDDKSLQSFDRFSESLKGHLKEMARTIGEKEFFRIRPVILRKSTGFVIDRGIVVTTQDMGAPRNAEEWVRVYSEKQIAYSTGELIGKDSETNIAVIRLASPGSSLVPSIRLPGRDDIEVGSFVFAFYQAYNQPLSMRTGEITGINRTIPFFHCASFLETSFPTCPGSLGAPIVDLEGRLVGMTSVFMAQGTMSEVTFAIPASQIVGVLDQILEHGQVERGCMGIIVDEVVDAEANRRLVRVKNVLNRSPAQQSGIRQGDIILALDGTPVHCRTSLISALTRFRPNDRVTVDISRNNERKTVQVSLAPLDRIGR